MKLKCDLIIQNLNNLSLSHHANTQEKLHKAAQIGLYRHRLDDETEDDSENSRKSSSSSYSSLSSQSNIILTIEAKSLSMKYKLKRIETYTKFIQEGKATLKLIDENIYLLISNTTSLTLINFISFLNIKMARSNSNIQTAASNNKSSSSSESSKNQIKKPDTKSYANKLLNNAQFSIGKNLLSNISPLCEKEVNDVIKSKAAAASNLIKTNGGSKYSQSPVRAGTSMNRYKTFSHSPNSKPMLKRSISSLLDSSSSETPAVADQQRKLSRQLSSTSNLFVELTGEQKQVMRAIKDGKNIFFTGSGGSGKSFLISVIRKMFNHETCFVTASTGVAASLIGGITLHAFAGIGAMPEHELGGNKKNDEEFEAKKLKDTIARIMASKEKLSNWKKCKQLVIDEISMIDGDLFDTLDQVAR